MKRMLFVLSLVLLTGCGSAICPNKSIEKSSDKFSLVASTDGKVYRLDKQTGDVVLITPEGIKPIGAPNDPLGIRK